VMEGRDIGTRVFPDAPFKFFLTAPPSVRALRRAVELARRGRPEPYEKVLAEMETRDRDDATRADSPLTFDERYILVVDVAGRGRGSGFIVAVRQLRRGGEHLDVDACAIHQPQARIQFGATARADAALGCGIGSAEVDEHVEIRVGPVVRVHIDTHVCQRYSVERHADRRLVISHHHRSGTSVG